MLKCRFRVSLHHLFTGYNGLVSARKMVLPIISVQWKGFESLKQPLHTLRDGDDDFAELGLPVERVGGVIRKLMTGKPEPFLKINGTEKKLHRSPVTADSCLNIKDVVSRKVGNSSAPSLDLQNKNNGRSNFRRTYSVTIKNVPSIIDSHELEEAISVFGKVTKASKRSVPNGLDCCDIEFKRTKSSMGALSAGFIIVRKFVLTIVPLHPLEAVMIRIRNISLETQKSAILSTCKLCGLFVGFVRVKEDVVDALFTVKDETDTKSILDKLNDTVMDEFKWSARLKHNESPSVAMTEKGNAEDDLRFKIGGHMIDLEREMRMKQICVEDLQHLYHCVFHLENHPIKADISSPPSTESEL